MKLVNKGEILSDSVDDIYDIIFREYTHKGFCDVDFEGVKAITTKFAGKLFGRLYDNLGKEEFYKNIHIITSTERVDFVEMRNRRDATMFMPKLILSA